MEISRDEFYRAIDALRDDLKDGLAGTHDRLDVLNGRTLKGEVAHAELRADFRGLEKVVYRRRRTDAGDDDEPERSPAMRKGLITLGLSVIIALLKLIEFLWDKLAHLMSSK